MATLAKTKKSRPTARLRYVSIPPRKMRLVADMVRGLPIEQALDILNYTPKIAARHLAKTLKSAAANILSSEGTDHVHAEDLYVKNIMVDAAPTAKRIRFQAMGRVYRIRKRFCHVSVWLDELDEGAVATAPKAPEKPARKTAKKTTKKAAAKKTSRKKKADEAEEEAAPAKGKKKPATKKARAKAAADEESNAVKAEETADEPAATDEKKAAKQAAAESENAAEEKPDENAGDEQKKDE